MYVNKIIDPRGPLELASRDELYAYAKANNVTEIDEAMYMGGYAGERMKKILIAKGLTNCPTALRNFAGLRPVDQQVQDTVTNRAAQEMGVTLSVDELINKPQQPLAPRVQVQQASKLLTRAALAKECKRLGIKIQRTDNKEKLQERLSGAYPA